MANGTIAKTNFSINRYDKITEDKLKALSAAIAKLEAASINVDNCGNCTPANCCQQNHVNHSNFINQANQKNHTNHANWGVFTCFDG